MRDVVTTLIELAGFACLVAAAFTFGIAPGLAVAGVALLAIGFLAGR